MYYLASQILKEFYPEYHRRRVRWKKPCQAFVPSKRSFTPTGFWNKLIYPSPSLVLCRKSVGTGAKAFTAVIDLFKTFSENSYNPILMCF
jgi:hypothetical protein